MEVEFTLQAKEDLVYWKKSNNTVVLKRIRKIVESIAESPYQGLGKPEPLKYNLTGCWSRRITKEHRVVYEVGNGVVTILSLRGHY